MKSILGLAVVVSIVSVQAWSMDAQTFSRLDHATQSEISLKSLADVDLGVEQSEQIKMSFLVAGREVFDIWGDTILGGPYTELGHNWWIEDKQLVFYSGELIAIYGVTVNWAVDYNDEICDFDYLDLHGEWNSECIELRKGWIKEPFYADLKGQWVWMDTYASFIFKD